MSRFRQTLAIDLGTATVLVFEPGKGIISNEPSVVAMDAFNKNILAVGSRAKKMLGRTPGNIIATKPMKDGVIADFNATEKMLSYFIKKARGRRLLRPNVIICVPSQSTQVQKRAILQASNMAGANRTYLIEEPLAAGMGAGLNLSDPGGNLIIDIGGGTTDVAVIAGGGIVINSSIKIAGDSFDRAIIRYIRTKYNMLIGERTAEDIKINISTAILEDLDSRMYEVRGRSLLNGLPMNIFVTSTDIFQALDSTINEIVKTVHEVLDKTPPELAGDLFDKGAVLTGGGSLIPNLDLRIEDKIGIRVKRDAEPVVSVVKGTGKASAWINRLETDDKSYVEARRKALEQKELLRKR